MDASQAWIIPTVPPLQALSNLGFSGASPSCLGSHSAFTPSRSRPGNRCGGSRPGWTCSNPEEKRSGGENIWARSSSPCALEHKPYSPQDPKGGGHGRGSRKARRGANRWSHQTTEAGGPQRCSRSTGVMLGMKPVVTHKREPSKYPDLPPSSLHGVFLCQPRWR